MTSTSDRQQTEPNSGTRFLKPDTAVADRIDQLILTEPYDKHLHERRQKQAGWLKHSMALHWKTDLPQPFIGFDLDGGLFIAEWQSETECNTLTIDAESGRAWYDPWPAGAQNPELPEEFDLNKEEDWECLRNVLTRTPR